MDEVKKNAGSDFFRIGITILAIINLGLLSYMGLIINTNQKRLVAVEVKLDASLEQSQQVLREVRVCRNYLKQNNL